MSKVRVISLRREWVTLHGKRNVLLLIHHLCKFIESDTLISIYIQSAHNGNDLRLRSVPAIHPTEIHDVIVIEEALTSVVNCLESSHVRPVNSALEVVL